MRTRSPSLNSNSVIHLLHLKATQLLGKVRDAGSGVILVRDALLLQDYVIQTAMRLWVRGNFTLKATEEPVLVAGGGDLDAVAHVEVEERVHSVTSVHLTSACW